MINLEVFKHVINDSENSQESSEFNDLPWLK
jgi:hypothetical protein